MKKSKQRLIFLLRTYVPRWRFDGEMRVLASRHVVRVQEPREESPYGLHTTALTVDRLVPVRCTKEEFFARVREETDKPTFVGWDVTPFVRAGCQEK